MKVVLFALMLVSLSSISFAASDECNASVAQLIKAAKKVGTGAAATKLGTSQKGKLDIAVQKAYKQDLKNLTTAENMMRMDCALYDYK